MLRIESHVFVLCTILVLLLHTFAVEVNTEYTENENNGGRKEEISDSDGDDIEVSRVLDQWDAKRTKDFESLLTERSKDKKPFLIKYISLMKSLKGEEQVYLHTGSEKSRFKKKTTSIKNFFTAILEDEAFFIEVSTETIFEDSYEEIMLFDKAEDILKRYLGVVFDNNPHFTLGENNDWLYLLSKEIFNPSRKLFKYVDPNNTNGDLEIDPDSKNNEDYLKHFKFVGRVFGLALYYEKRIRVNLKPVFYTRILRDYPQIDPQNYPLWKKTEEQMSAFIEGLTDLIPSDKLKEFNESELQSLFCDTGYLDLEQWKKYTLYKSNIKETVQWFWEIIEGYNESERRKVLFFITGTDALPVSGFINDWLPFKIKKKKRITPFATQHVRANEPYRTLELPAYESKEELIKQMNKIVGKHENEKMN